MLLQAALDRFAFMFPTTALGVLIALQPLALLKKQIQASPSQTMLVLSSDQHAQSCCADDVHKLWC